MELTLSHKAKQNIGIFAISTFSVIALGLTVKRNILVSNRNKIVRTTKKYLGENEISGNKGFENLKFENKIKSLGWTSGEQWCNFFVRLVFLEALKHTKYFDIIQGNNWNHRIGDGTALITSLCMQTWKNFKNDNSGLFEVSQKASEGAMVVWQSYSDANSGHIGIVVKHNPLFFLTIEGNANYNIVKLKDYKKLKKDNSFNYSEQTSDGSVQYCIRSYKGDGMKLLGFISIK